MSILFKGKNEQSKNIQTGTAESAVVLAVPDKQLYVGYLFEYVYCIVTRIVHNTMKNIHFVYLSKIEIQISKN